jgi:peptidoglycan/LPS O-acetylase OafA/YrhL
MKINNFDLLRLVLAFFVFLAHWNFLTGQHIDTSLFHLGDYAVDMFFIVSGFLIFWSFDNDQNKKHFYIKRFFRIFPLYAFLVLLQTLFFIGFSDGSAIETVKYFLVNIFFLNFLAPSVGSTLNSLEIDAINGSLWTLKNEVVFYMFVPLIFMLYKKWGGYFLMILYSLSVLYMLTVDYLGISKLLVQFPAQLRLFVVGILLYTLFDKFKDKNIYFLAIGSLIFIVLFKDFDYFKFSIYPLLLGILVIYLVYFVKLMKIDFDFSYSFYILHFPVIQLALYFGINPSNPLVSFTSLFLIILLLSYFSEKYIEKKFVSIGKNIIKKDRNEPN